jgi:flagellar basal body-associated protein FliL
MGIIIGLVIALVIVVVIVNAIQQHKEKQEQEKRAKAAKQKAIIDETEELLLNLAHLPPNPKVVEILNQRSLNAVKNMAKIMPEMKGIKNKITEMEARLNASVDLASSNAGQEQSFILPDNDQQLVVILQTIKKLRAMLKSEQSKGALDAQAFTMEDLKLDAMQLKINVESLHKRGIQAHQKEMLGSARQYYEKAIQTISEHPKQTDYTAAKKTELEDQLEEITASLKNTNAADAAKKAKAEEDDLDMLFQPKKKW